MPYTRRRFFQSTGALAAGLASATSSSAQAPTANVQVPKVKFGKVEISRIVLGANPFYGYGHFTPTYDRVMREWYTPAKVVEVLQECASYGINAFQYFPSSRCQSDYERFVAEGGKMHLIVQAAGDPKPIVESAHPLAIYHGGEFTDNAWRAGTMNVVKDWCKRVRQTGVMVGVGSHMPEVLAQVESEGWDVDFYAGCVYNRRRTPEEFRKMLGGELLEMPSEIYLQADPPRMYKVMRQIPKPCFAFKVLGAGRVAPETGFKLAIESLKPNDCMFVGMFPRLKDEIKENAEVVAKILQSRTS